MRARIKNKHKDVMAALPFWRKAAYQSKSAEFILYFLVMSGLLLWDGFGFPWQVTRPSLAIHFIVSLILFPLFVVPFWLSHRALLKKSQKPEKGKSCESKFLWA